MFNHFRMECMMNTNQDVADIKKSFDETISQIKDLHAQIKADYAAGQENTKTAKAAIAKADDALMKYGELSKRLTIIEQKGESVSGDDETPEIEKKSVGQIFAETVAKKGISQEKIRVDVKDLSSTTAGGWLRVERDKTVIRPPRDERSFLDLIPVITVGDDVTSFEANKEVTATNNAAFVAELAQKPVSVIEYGKQTIYMKTLATLLHMSKQVFKKGGDDLRVDIDNTLFYFLRTALEKQVLLGNGQGENLTGLVTQANSFTNLSPNVTNVGSIGKLRLGLLQSAASGYRPDSIIISAYDWAAIELEKDDVGHFLISDPRIGATKELWGVEVFETFAMPQNQWVINDMARTARLYRTESGVELGYFEQNVDNVEKNRITVRAEEEIGFGCLSTAALVAGDYSAISGGGDNGGGDTPDNPDNP